MKAGDFTGKVLNTENFKAHIHPNDHFTLYDAKGNVYSKNYPRMDYKGMVINKDQAKELIGLLQQLLCD